MRATRKARVCWYDASDRTSVFPLSVQGTDSVVCYRCGNKGHTVAKCRVPKEVVCHKCGKRGHFQCRKEKPRRNKRKTQRVGHVQEGEEEQSESEPEEQTSSILNHLQSKGVPNAPPIMVKVRVDDCVLNMEVDTGAAHSLINI